MSAKSKVRHGLEATIGKQRTNQVRKLVRGQAKTPATDPVTKQMAFHIAKMREELAKTRKTEASILTELRALRANSGLSDATNRTVNGLQAVRREIQTARSIPSVPIALRQRSVEQSVEHVATDPHFGNVMVGLTKSECLNSALEATTIDGMVGEFGVFQGESLTRIAQYFPDRTIHGFDSFAGLPEAWSGTSKGAGAFDIGGTPPDVPVDNVEFHVGFFDTTVPEFAASHSGPFAFVHLDADLYSSTKTVMDTLFDWFVPGTIIVFDEYFGYHGWQNHEHKAFMELLERGGFTYEAISLGHMNLGVRLLAGTGRKGAK